MSPIAIQWVFFKCPSRASCFASCVVWASSPQVRPKSHAFERGDLLPTRLAHHAASTACVAGGLVLAAAAAVVVPMPAKRQAHGKP